MAVTMQTSSTHWLNLMHSNGIRVTSAELMYYRNKVSAFQRHQRLQPPKSQTGAILSKHKGRGMEFDEVRHYQAGDDVRSIDWRVTARTGTPHTKLYREERERPVMVIVDLGPSLQFGTQLLVKSVQACHLAAALGWLAISRNDRIGGLISSGIDHREVRPQGRQHGMMRLIQALVEQQHRSNDSLTQATRTLDDLIQRTQQVARPGTIVHCISDWLTASADTFDRLLAIRRHCQIHAYQLSDPFELNMPLPQASNPLAITDGIQSPLVMDTEQRRAYLQAMQMKQDELSGHFQQLGIRPQRVDAGQALEQQWVEVMR